MFDGILGYIVGGAVIGVLARFIKPGADPMGWILTILLGVAGAGASMGTAWGAEPAPAATASAPAGSHAPVTDEAGRETAEIDAALRDADRHFGAARQDRRRRS